MKQHNDLSYKSLICFLIIEQTRGKHGSNEYTELKELVLDSQSTSRKCYVLKKEIERQIAKGYLH